MSTSSIKYPEFIPALWPSAFMYTNPKSGEVVNPTLANCQNVHRQDNNAILFSVITTQDYEGMLAHCENHLIYAQREWLEKEVSGSLTPRQVLPYHIFYKEATADLPRRYFTYQRKEGGGEPRLSRQFSVGVGGHPEITDGVSPKCGRMDLLEQSSFKHMLERSSVREINEEVECINKEAFWAVIQNQYGQGGSYVPHFPPSRFPEAFKFLIVDHDNEVGRLHIAFVFLHQVHEVQELVCKEPLLATHGFLSVKEIYEKAQAERREVEGWSQRALEMIARSGISWGKHAT